MRIGVPRETKDGEFRVALTPSAIAKLPFEVVFEPGAGTGAGFSDEEFKAQGAKPGNAWDCELVVKVKELQESEYALPKPGQVLFSFQHFGPHPELLEAALASGATFIAFETVGQSDASLPILAPMSAIAGRLAVQAGAWCLQKHNGGSNALAVAHGIGAGVTVFARSEKRISALRIRYKDVEFHIGTDRLASALFSADLVIGGVLTPGQMSPKLISRAMLSSMRRGSALVDVGIDQGGIAETSRPTSHSAPVYVEEGVVHYCVPNMPAACARTASLALERAVLPYVFEILSGKTSNSLRTGIQVKAGKITHAQLARDTNRPHHPL
jgi:alanine dehydrogenase